MELDQSKSFDDTSNVVIRGDNLDVLKILKKNYYGVVKMIYIDPPYNTENDEFVYNDDFVKNEKQLIEELGLGQDTIERFQNLYGTKTHSGWLAFMYPRLKVAKELLAEDGVIFISIDDNEQANLKLLCDEIFGECNFITNVIWQSKTGSSDAKTIDTVTEYILVYTKTKNDTVFLKNIGAHKIKRFRCKDEHFNHRGPYYPDTLDRGGLRYSDSLNFPITCPDGKTTYPNGRIKFERDGWTWKWSKEKVNWGIQNNFIVFKKSKNKESSWTVSYKNYLLVDNEGNKIKRSLPYKNMIVDAKTGDGAKKIKELFGRLIFKYTKPPEMISTLLKMVKIPSNGIILDFFAGSGTTGEAVMRLNAEDGGNRKFILVQLDEEIEKNQEAYEFCINSCMKPVISSITLERLNRAGDIIKKEYRDVDIGYKVFSLKPKPEINFDESQTPILSVVHTNRTSSDSLHNMLCTTGKPLDVPVETLIKDVLYRASGEIYMLDDADLTGYEEHIINMDGWSDNLSLERYLNVPKKVVIY